MYPAQAVRDVPFSGRSLSRVVFVHRLPAAVGVVAISRVRDRSVVRVACRPRLMPGEDDADRS